MMPAYCSNSSSLALYLCRFLQSAFNRIHGSKMIQWLRHLLLPAYFCGFARGTTKAQQLNDFKMYQNICAYTASRLQLPVWNLCLVLQHRLPTAVTSVSACVCNILKSHPRHMSFFLEGPCKQSSVQPQCIDYNSQNHILLLCLSYFYNFRGFLTPFST